MFIMVVTPDVFSLSYSKLSFYEKFLFSFSSYADTTDMTYNVEDGQPITRK